MRLLLDTHIAVWRLSGDARLTPAAIAVMDDPENHISVSTISIWEMAIKSSLQRKNDGGQVMTGTAFLNELGLAGITPIPIQPSQTVLVEQLPMLHKDPFDRALIATAKFEGMTLLTHDSKLSAYGDFVMVV